MKKLFAVAAVAALFASCAGKPAQATENTEVEATQEVVIEEAAPVADSTAVVVETPAETPAAE